MKHLHGLEFEQNESKHLDLQEWLSDLEDLGVNIAKRFPEVYRANERVDRLLSLRTKHKNTTPEINTAARRLGLIDDLDDADSIITAADHFAYGQDPDHRERVSALFSRAADFARGDAYNRFRRAPILDIMRPAFDELAERIVTASRTIPQGVIDIGDAARLGHADAYLQLERDLATWKKVAELVGAMHDAGVLVADRRDRWPAEFMLDDVQASREASGTVSHPLRRAMGIAAGRPNLHIPSGGEVTAPALLGTAEDTTNKWVAMDANEADKAAREALGLKK